MPFQLLILYHWKPEIKPERIEHHFRKIRALAGRVPGMQRVGVGPVASASGPDAQQWTHAGLMVFDRQSDYVTFGSSAAHDEIAPQLVADLAHIMVVGFDDEAMPDAAVP